MSSLSQLRNTEVYAICESLFTAAEKIYAELKAGSGLHFLDSVNETNDAQIGLDVFADQCFHEQLEGKTNVKFILSEEQPKLVSHGMGKYSVALDPLDGSKSALVGIPSGAIFGIFKDAGQIADFNGQQIVCGGFFVFGINLEVYFSIQGQAFQGVCAVETKEWEFKELPELPTYKMVAMNVSNKSKWNESLQQFYDDLMTVEDENGKSFNMRWYASMVSEMKRLVLQGGLFAYPADSRKGYEKGHLRLVYEAIPMAYLLESIGGAGSDGKQSLLVKKVSELHEKTAVFFGERGLIERVERALR